jgi:hypothetical protein
MREMPLKALVDVYFEAASKILTVDQQDVMQAFFIQSGNGTFHQIITPWRNSEERMAVLITIHHTLKTLQATRYVVISEAWVSLNVKGYSRASQDPQRQEVLIAVGVDRDGTVLSRSAKIVQQSDQNRRTIDPSDGISRDMEFVGGDLATLFDESWSNKTPPDGITAHVLGLQNEPEKAK